MRACQGNRQRPTSLYVQRIDGPDKCAKIPKWQPRSRRGQYVGVSPVHAENIAVIRNLQTGYLSPQYHIVFDDWFETVYADEREEPPDWEEMCIMDRFETVFDEGLEPPSLADEWLTPEEVAKNRTKRQVISLKQGRQLYHEVNKKAHREHSLLDNAQAVKPSPNKTNANDTLTPPSTAASPIKPRTPVRLDNWARAPGQPPPPPEPPPLAIPATDVGPSEPTSRYPQRARVNREQRYLR